VRKSKGAQRIVKPKVEAASVRGRESDGNLTEMTYEEVDAMVATEVMRWNLMDVPGTGECWLEPIDLGSTVAELEANWRPSRNLVHAMRAVDRLNDDKGLKFSLEGSKKDGWEAKVYAAAAALTDHSFHCDDKCLATCAAMLSACGHNISNV